MSATSAATRANVLRLRRRMSQVTRGAALLRKKREALVKALFELARPATDARRRIDEQALTAYRALREALAAVGVDSLHVLGWPTRDVRVDLLARAVGGIPGVDLARKPSVARTVAARGAAMGPGDAAASMAAEAFEDLVELLIEAAPEDALLRRSCQALAEVTRLVNTLEQRLAPALARELATTRRTLEEREREEHLRLRRRSSLSHRR